MTATAALDGSTMMTVVLAIAIYLMKLWKDLMKEIHKLLQGVHFWRPLILRKLYPNESLIY